MTYQLFLFDLDDTLLDFRASEKRSFLHTMHELGLRDDIDSLFTGGSTTALTQTIAGLDDFELTAFIAVVDPTEGGDDG